MVCIHDLGSWGGVRFSRLVLRINFLLYGSVDQLTDRRPITAEVVGLYPPSESLYKRTQVVRGNSDKVVDKGSNPFACTMPI